MFRTKGNYVVVVFFKPSALNCRKYIIMVRLGVRFFEIRILLLFSHLQKWPPKLALGVAMLLLGQNRSGRAPHVAQRAPNFFFFKKKKALKKI
jgi:hypothetical protein